MAQVATQLTEPSFTAWLSESCKRLGVNATRLHFGVARAGYFCREETVRRWMKGAAEPPAKAVPALLRALQDVTTKEDVFEDYCTWVARESNPEPTDQQSVALEKALAA